MCYFKLISFAIIRYKHDACSAYKHNSVSSKWIITMKAHSDLTWSQY